MKQNLTFDRIVIGMMVIALPLCTACSIQTVKNNIAKAEPLTVSSMPSDAYRSYYEIFPYSYADSNGDGIGDLNGITKTLDYINDGNPSTDSDLGYTGIWLTPIMPSDTYHKYDVKDYMNIDPQFGTMADFDNLISESHARGIRVMIDLVVNHTSINHPWFQQAAAYLRSIGNNEPVPSDCPYLEYYNFSRQNKDGYHLLKGTKWYYESRFWEGMPDLNLDKDTVWKEIDAITTFWLDHQVDGFRLDAAKEYYTGDDTKNIAALTRLNTMVKTKKKNAYIVAEVWMNRDSYAKYYASGIDSMFDFAFANNDGNTASLAKGSITASQYDNALVSEEKQYASYNANYINAPFYTNHDMGRSAGYYAGDTAEAATKFAGAMNLLQGGASFTYYGEEIGMKGAGKDENKRAPMNWGDGEYSQLICKGPKDMDPNIAMPYGTLAEQAEDSSSIYTYYKNAVQIRNAFPAIARGRTQVITQDNDYVGVLTKETKDEKICIVYNASSEVQKVSLAALKQAVSDSMNVKAAAAILKTSEEDITVNSDEMTLPAYSIVIYQ